MASHSKMTVDHDEIREWVEKHGGKPSTVAATHQGDDPGLLRIDFPGYSGEGSLEEISWEDFFTKFDESGLVFLYQEETAEGKDSRFCKLISGETAAAQNSVEAPEPAAKKTSSGSKKKSAAPAKKAAGKKAGAPSAKKQAAAKKAPAKKAPAKKVAAAKKAPAKKAPAKKAPAKKVAAKKTAAKKKR